MRILKNLTGLMFGAAIGMLIGLLMIPPAKSAEPTKQQVPLIIAYQDGKAQASTTLEIQDNAEACAAVLKAFLAANHGKPGVVLIAGCIPIPAAPVEAHQNDTTT
jgi:hypothetical protein